MNKKKEVYFPYQNLKFIKTHKLLEKKFSYYTINQMVEAEMIKKVNGKTYENLSYSGDENDFLYVSGYVDAGVVCLMSAAAYHGITTFRPSQIDAAIPQKSKVKILPDWPKIEIYYFSDERYQIGVLEIEIEGGSFKIYDREKTVCDVITYRNKIGIDETISVVKNYLSLEDRNLNKLIRYSKKLKSYSTLSKYLEALL
jgi:predicted transcriptional regulator of viral defense system